MSSIAFSLGFFWETLWNLPANADLKALRTDPNVLLAGDIVHIPDLTVKQVPCATNQQHKFTLKSVPEKLRLKLLDSQQQPRANVPYTLVIDGVSTSGTTTAAGEVVENISPNAKAGQIMLGQDRSEILPLQLGNLDPISAVTGLKGRLANLGLYNGPVDNNMDDATTQALRSFQQQQNLPVTGVADDATTNQLQQLHGH